MVQMPKPANGPIEVGKRLVRAAARRARGYRSVCNPIAIAHRIAAIKLATCEPRNHEVALARDACVAGARQFGRYIKSDA
jgi:hypothetical protein